MTEDDICALSASQAARAISQLQDPDASRITVKFLRRSGFPPAEMLSLTQREAGRPLSYWNEVLEQLKQEPHSDTALPESGGTHHLVLETASSSMTVWGMLLLALSVGLGVWTAAFEVSVASSSSEYPSRIINTGLLADRTLLASCSATFFLSGIFLLAAGQIEKEIRRARS